ncbi:RBBP9/YdeN family alpha/beta hydrolase [Kribbella sp. NPDC051586]|uniref:RBBP9/YdeN family alpha/beta hydrolase n=1 Tax=Kribbella sp. NPDC051586 TaxID=3364118 RepID=UPI0037A01C25
MTFVIIPGLDGSDEHHWQSLWEHDWLTPAIRIQPSSWTTPDLTDWSAAITRAAESTPDTIIFITHSLGCHALSHWLTQSPPPPHIRGAFLVAPPDPQSPTFPADRLPTFTSLPAAPLPIPSLLITSTNDPYCTPTTATHLAQAWSTPHIPLPNHGHINTPSNLATWPTGQFLLTAFLAGLNLDVDAAKLSLQASNHTTPDRE